METMRRDLKGSMCIGLANDADDARINAWLSYLSSLSASDLVAAGAPKSFFDIFADPHPLFKSTGVTLTELWQGKWKALFKERAALMDALLLSLVAYNDWIRAAGDSSSSLSSTALRTGYRTIASTPIPNWRATLQGSSFAGLTGPVSFNTQGERNVDYMVYSASGPSLAFTPVFRLNQNGNLVQLVSSITYNDGTTQAPFDREPPCSPGYRYVVAERGCVICPEGQTCVGGRFPAIPCAAGTAAPTKGLTQCIDCPIGTTSKEGKTCVACDPGFGAPAEAMFACTQCPAGTSWKTVPAPAGVDGRLNLTKVAACVKCDIGEYAAQGELTCTKCSRSHTTTRFKGSTRHEECVCKPGFYRPCSGDAAACPKDNYAESDARSCVECPEGMDCALGSDMVNLKLGLDEAFAKSSPGFMTLAAEPLSVYKCKPTAACPGGAPDACSKGRISASCGTCPEGLSLIGGKCKACTGLDWTFLVVYLLVIPVAVIALYLTSGAMHAWRGNPGASLSVALRMALRCIQILTVFTLTTVNWPSVIEDSMEGGGNFNFAVPFACIAQNTVVLEYVGGMLTLPIAFISLLLLFLVLKATSTPWSGNSAFAVWGKICATMFVSQVTLCMLPFMCYTHPNGSSSVLQYTATLCGSNDHIYMVIVAVIGVLLAIAFASFCAYKTCKIKAIVEADDAHVQLERILFVIDDYRTGLFSAFMWMRLQEFCLALTMVINPDDSYLQILYFFTIMLIATSCICASFPWKFPFHNIMHVAFNVGALCFLLLAKDYVVKVSSYDGSVSYVLIVGVVLAFTFIVLLLVPALNRLLRGGKGEMFVLMNLGSFPTEEKLDKLWGSVSSLSADDIHSALSMWQIYDVLVFEQTLTALSSKRSSIMEH
eukprot:TRINITY_DN4054_c0_g1_i4.p1 TRINITY_DN4054_c0_g1~~TRINITY_DN4054_c0_g1_i4.p1  ORF type:complete len:933 (+),score=119.22 TRINITY_DN4054_c0_g1_i4:154-2799(+)